MQETRIGLLGAGNIAGALLRGLIASRTVSAERVRASDVRADRLAELERAHGISTCLDNSSLTSWADVVVLAVKPQVIPGVLEEMAPAVDSSKLLISVAAGVPISALQARLPDKTRIVRVMPNTAALVLAGATAIAPGPAATAEDVALASSLFAAVGRTAVLDEALMNVATGLSGSGPAYVMLMIEALADGAVRLGMTRETALLLTAQTLYGAAKLQLETGTHPAQLKDQVTSPGGTTAAGLHALEAGAVRAALMAAVGAATERAEQLGAASAKTR